MPSVFINWKTIIIVPTVNLILVFKTAVFKTAEKKKSILEIK